METNKQMINLAKFLESKENIGDIVHHGLSEASDILSDNPKTETVMAVVVELEDAFVHVAVSRKDGTSFRGTHKKHNLRVLK